MRKTVCGVYQANQAVKATEDGWRLQISDLGSRGMYYLCGENKGADYNSEADLRLCFSICKNQVFS